jgi:transposase
MKRAKEEGVEGLRHKPPPGAISRLSEQERAKLPELLAQGARCMVFEGMYERARGWLLVIRREFGVGYHPAHISHFSRS